MTAEETEPVEQQFAVNPVGMGLAVLGAALATISIFLPLADTTAFPLGVKGNTLAQGQAGAAFIYVALAIGVLATTFRYHSNHRSQWGVFVLGILILAAAVVHGHNDSLFTLTSIDPVSGSTDYSTPNVRADAAIALYVAGAGGIFALVGGWIMRRGSEPFVAVEPPALEPAPEQTTKVCPECAESVQDAARVCRYCGHRFDTIPSTSA